MKATLDEAYNRGGEYAGIRLPPGGDRKTQRRNHSMVDVLPVGVKTSDLLAAKYGVAATEIFANFKFYKAVNAIVDAVGAYAKDRIIFDLQLTANTVVRLSKLDVETQKRVLDGGRMPKKGTESAQTQSDTKSAPISSRARTRKLLEDGKPSLFTFREARSRVDDLENVAGRLRITHRIQHHLDAIRKEIDDEQSR